ncbi:hypothetical protein QRD02_07420 [Aequorivita sp. SDUM287046]|uniref:Right handed beta helix domain-containing protein n=1 Tax=Aequorivita aurantiaca TaxID=3053356 RepID=A0ABT8DMD7_9FLAO|nr:hypothetical protein [Aequorivita aurantiaca]MDN3724207.1 hypothetical protein [Aequorivita aurantiaca]
MKKFYVLTCCFLVANFAFAQLNGSYVIGGPPSDYTTIKNAVTDLTTVGISGPVVFNIKDGTYTEQNINITAIAGTSAANTVTFQSESLNAENVTVKGNKIFVVRDGAQYITFKHLKLDTYTNSNLFRRAFDVLGPTTSHITISHCKFVGGSSSLTSETFNGNETNRFTHTFMLISNPSHLTISNNDFGTIGAVIFKQGLTNQGFANTVTIANNIFSGTMITPLHLKRVNDLTFHNNTFTGNVKYRTLHTTILSGTTTISSNKMYVTNSEYPGPSGYTTYINNSSVEAGNLIFINNFLAQMASLATSDFDNMTIANNSFASNSSHCLGVFGDTKLVSVNLQNNIFHTDSESPNLLVGQNLDLNKLTANHNAFSKEKDAIVYLENSYTWEYFDLQDWKSFSGKEANSKVVRDVYTSTSDFHTPNAFLLDGAGVPIAEVTHDIDGENRNPSTPDIGADEFTQDPNTYMDLELVEIVSPTTAPCDTSDVVLALKNNSATTITNFEIECAINGNRGNIASYNINIPSTETVLVNVTNCSIMGNTNYAKIEFFLSNPNGQLDNNYSNDHKSILNIFQLEEFPIFTENSECETDTNLIVPFMHGTTLLWSTGETTNVITVDQLGTYTVTATGPQGCQVTNSITLD